MTDLHLTISKKVLEYFSEKLNFEQLVLGNLCSKDSSTVNNFIYEGYHKLFFAVILWWY